MKSSEWIREQTPISLQRLSSRLHHDLRETIATDREAWSQFERRLQREWPRLFAILVQLYGQEYDFFYHLEQLLLEAARSWFARSAELKQLDLVREADPDWFTNPETIGAVCYVDLFAGTLNGLRERVGYLKQLGVTYLHLMPLFVAPEGNNDGGYAVSSYRHVNPELGTIEDLAAIARDLRAEGISLVVDFVFNHTSNEHEWARRAQAGEVEYRNFYWTFPDRTMPDRYDATLREIFPTVRRGSFSWSEPLQRWVWTTFNNFQWDLNYQNPAVFRAMASEMLFLANTGIEVLRLDAVAFIWKQLGTNCENLPEAHLLIQAFNAVARIAAPALLFKSEAIVHPDEVKRYISPGEAQLSYHPLLMALVWEALATRQVRLLSRSLATRHNIPEGCSWTTYLRCHDDIGWTFDDDDARQLGIDPYGHRRFLNSFYVGEFPRSFARGLPFQYNPATGDQRISGTLASLAGLEEALKAGNERLVDMALRRILMLHSVILSVGGIPLLYLGDEYGMLNDYSYAGNPAHADDSRWVHRVRADWERLRQRNDLGRPEGFLFHELCRLIALRKSLPALTGTRLEVVDSGSDQVLAYTRSHRGERLLIFVNFSEQPQSLHPNRLRLNGLAYDLIDRNTGRIHHADEALILAPYQFVWLAPSHAR